MPEPIENDSPEMSFRRGYQHGVIDVFSAIERFLDPAAPGSFGKTGLKKTFTYGGRRQCSVIRRSGVYDA